jgi:hypothetical protein
VEYGNIHRLLVSLPLLEEIPEMISSYSLFINLVRKVYLGFSARSADPLVFGPMARQHILMGSAWWSNAAQFMVQEGKE